MDNNCYVQGIYCKSMDLYIEHDFKILVIVLKRYMFRVRTYVIMQSNNKAVYESMK